MALYVFRFLMALTTPVAHAVRLENAGQDGPGGASPAVAAMWAQICNVLPFCTIGADGPAFIAAKISRFILSLITGTAICFLIYAGIRVTISQGDEEGVGVAKKTAMYALLGIALTIMAQAIIYYIEYWVLTEALQ